MTIFVIIITSILSVLYSIQEGVREGMYWHYKSKSGNETMNEHPIFFAQRTVFFISIAMIIFSNLSLLTSFFHLSSLVLVFPYFHGGYMYAIRNGRNDKIYKKGFKSDPSETSTAKINFKYKTRLYMFIIAISLEVIHLIINLSN